MAGDEEQVERGVGAAVGEGALHDVQGARDAGLRAVWVNRRQESWPDTYAAPDAEVRHVGEVCALVGVRRP